jgi:hypothetical protein
MFLGLAAFNSFVHFVGYNKARLLTKYVLQRKYVYYWQNRSVPNYWQQHM